MKKEQSKTSKVLKTIAGVATTVIAILAIVIALNKFGVINIGNETNPSSPSNPPVVLRLDTVQNLSYNESNSLLSWDEVAHTDMYKIDVNGSQQDVSTNLIYFVPVDKISNIKVQAYDTTGTYQASNWSSVLTYTIPDNQMNLASVNNFVNYLHSEYKLKNIASMYIDGNKLYTQGHFVDYYGKDKVVKMESVYEKDISTLEEAMTSKILTTNIYQEYDYSDYDSAKYLLQSNSFAGQMEEYRQQGYTFEVVSSEVGNRGIDELVLYGTYRLTNGSEVKYIECAMSCGITNASTSEKVNYTVKLADPSARVIEELSCHELTGDFANWAELKYQNKQLTTSNSSYSNSGNGMDLF